MLYLCIRLAELIPGLPPPDLAASVDATSLCSPHLGHWLRDPCAHLLPRNEWPSVVPKAKVQVESDLESITTSYSPCTQLELLML